MSPAAKKRWLKATLCIGVAAAAVGLVGYFNYLHSKGTVDDYKDRLRAAGEKLNVDELIPPQVPPEQNGAELILRVGKRAAGTFLYTNPPPAMRMVAPGKAMVGWKRPEIRGYGTNSWGEADAALAGLSSVIELLQQAAQRPKLDFALNYHQGFTLLLPHLVQMKQSVQLLSAAAICDLHRGDPAAAVTNLHTSLALVEKWNEPLLISQLVRFAMTQIALGPTWELSQTSGASDDQLAMLQSDWARLEFINPAEDVLSMERAMAEVTLANIRKSNSALESLVNYDSSSSSSASSGDWLEDVSDYGKSVWRGTKLRTKEVLWRVSWSFTDELRMLRGEQALIDAVRLARTNGCFKDALAQQERKLAELGFSSSGDYDFLSELSLYGNDPADMDVRWILSSSVLSLSGYPKRVLVAEAAKRLAVTAIALKRFQLRHGNCPTELSALVPELLPRVPRDPVDGQPLRYRLNPDGTFLLYSIGDDAVDGGGDPNPKSSPSSFSWQRGRDWVWPQPATDAEIESFEGKSSSARP